MTSKLTRERLQEIAEDGFLKHGESKELARMALIAMDSEPVKRVNADQMHHVCLEANRHLDKYGAMAKEVNKLLGRIPAQPAPVVQDGYVMVPKYLLSELRDWAHPEIEKYCEMWEGRRDSEFPALRKVIADADALLAAAPQEVNHG